MAHLGVGAVAAADGQPVSALGRQRTGNASLMIAGGLRRMGRRNNVTLLIAKEKELLAGVAWADTGWKNITHYYHP